MSYGGNKYAYNKPQIVAIKWSVYNSPFNSYYSLVALVIGKYLKPGITTINDINAATWAN